LRYLSLFLLATLCGLAPARGALAGEDLHDFTAICTQPPDEASAFTVAIILRTLQEDDCALADERAHTLTQVSLPREMLTDLRPFQGWAWMTGLEFTGNQIVDSSPLGKIASLQQAYLAQNRITSLEFARTTPALFRLRMADNQLTDLEPLRAATALQDLDVSRNAGFHDVSPLRGLPLVRLGLSQAVVGGDVAALFPQPLLQTLDLSKNGIVDLAPLAAAGALPVIKSLLLRGNQIVDAAPLALLTTVTALDLADNPIADLTPLKALTQLVALDVSRVPAPQLSEVVGTLHLKELLAAATGLTDLSWSQSLASDLRTLDLSGNAIADVSALTRFKDLAVLKLGGNPITDIDTDWLASLTNLKVLEIDVATIENAEKRHKILEIMALAFERNRG
jgi:internalin A